MDRRVQIITGHYGSGKTEIAVNLALRFAAEGQNVALADLDIVNPYFRSAERRKLLEDHGVRLIATSFSGYIDLPAVTPEVLTVFENKAYRGIVDMGGDPEGAHVLGRFENRIEADDFDMLCVLNANRPETSTPEKALLYLRGIEIASGQKMTGIISNTHLCRETRVEDILKGAKLAAEVSKESGLPVVWHAVERRFVEEVRYQMGEGEILPIDIYMCKPWEFGMQ